MDVRAVIIFSVFSTRQRVAIFAAARHLATGRTYRRARQRRHAAESQRAPDVTEYATTKYETVAACFLETATNPGAEPPAWPGGQRRQAVYYNCRD